MKINKIIIDTKNKKYPVYVGANILNKVPGLIEKKLPKTKKIGIVVDENLPSKILNKLKTSLKKYELKIYKFKSKDKIKNIKIAVKLIDSLLKNNFDRSDCIISFGGGVVGDLSAFVSSITKRGINFVNIPTTLLAQVDASIGGKTAINSLQGKNLIGTFHQPEFVIIDIEMLNSLPHREMVCGYGEILKHSLILDKKFFSWLLKHGKKVIKKNKISLKYAITKSCQIKSKIINMDEKEENMRMILNFGHSFGHAFEATKKFSKDLNHGEAILLGMIIASEFSYEKKKFSHKELSAIKKHYLALKLPMKIGDYFRKKDLKKIVFFITKDKKSYNKKINLILLKKIGKTVELNKTRIDINVIKKFLNSKLIK